MSTTSAKEPTPVYNTHTLRTKTKECETKETKTVRSVGTARNCSLAPHVTGSAALARAEFTEKDDIQLFANSFAITTEKENSI